MKNTFTDSIFSLTSHQVVVHLNSRPWARFIFSFFLVFYGFVFIYFIVCLMGTIDIVFADSVLFLHASYLHVYVIVYTFAVVIRLPSLHCCKLYAQMFSELL